MKPLGVLVIVIVAVAGLFFAINNLGGGSGTEDQSVESISQDSTPVDAPQGNSGSLANPDRNVRESVTPTGSTGERVVAAPTGKEQYDNVVSGLVLNSNHEPLAAASVTLTRGGLAGMLFINEAMDRSQDLFATTNKDGKYIFVNVEPYDRYAIEANAEGYSQAERPNLVVNTSGDVNLQPILLTVGASLSGTVLDNAGNAVPGAVMRLDGMFARMDGNPAADSLSTVSNAAGHYIIPNVPAGNRTLNVKAEGYANQVKGSLVFRGEEPLTMDLTLEIAEMICGKVISRIGKPVPGAKVLAISTSNSSRHCRDEIFADENGEFCLKNVAAGQYNVAVTAKGFRPGNENRVKTGAASLIIELAVQGLVNGRVVAASGPAPTPYVVQLRQTHPGNTVTSAIGKPLTLSEADGSFSIECGSTGTFLIQATAPGYSPSFSEEFRFTVGQPMNGVVVHLTAGGSISGSVLNAEGKPVSRPRITTHDNTWTNSLFDRALGNQFPTNITPTAGNGNGQGKFKLDSLRPETYQLRVRAPGYCEATLQDVFVTEGKDTNVGNIQLIRGGEINGTVIDLAGRPVMGAKVRLNPASGGEGLPHTYEITAGGDGTYSIKNIFPGKYKLSAAPTNSASNFLQAFSNELDNVQPVQIKDGESQHFELKIDS